MWFGSESVRPEARTPQQMEISLARSRNATFCSRQMRALACPRWRTARHPTDRPLCLRLAARAPRTGRWSRFSDPRYFLSACGADGIARRTTRAPAAVNRFASTTPSRDGIRTDCAPLAERAVDLSQRPEPGGANESVDVANTSTQSGSTPSRFRPEGCLAVRLQTVADRLVRTGRQGSANVGCRGPKRRVLAAADAVSARSPTSLNTDEPLLP
jgi:hypothetical protein